MGGVITRARRTDRRPARADRAADKSASGKAVPRRSAAGSLRLESIAGSLCSEAVHVGPGLRPGSIAGRSRIEAVR